MRRRWTTASRLDRGALCPASTVLPEAKSELGKSAIWGNGAHAYIETGEIPKDAPDWVRKGLADKIMCSGFVREEWYPPGAHEVQGYLDGPNLDEVSIVPGGHKDWPERESSIRVKIDYTGEHNGAPWVEDLKTGRYPIEPSALQVAAAALLVAQLVGSKVAYGTVLHWPRYKKSDLPRRSKFHLFDQDGLEATRERLLMLRAVALGPNPAAIPGEEQCRWCSCLPNCPEGLEYKARQSA